MPLSYWPYLNSRGRILGGNPDKSLKSFPPCYFTSTALPWDFYFFKLTQLLTVSIVHCCTLEKGGKPDRKPHPLPYGLRNPYTEISSLRTLKIMPRNLKETVRSWIRFNFLVILTLSTCPLLLIWNDSLTLQVYLSHSLGTVLVLLVETYFKITIIVSLITNVLFLVRNRFPIYFN